MSESFNIENKIARDGITREQFHNSEFAKQLNRLEQAHIDSVFDEFNTTKAKFPKDDILDVQEQAAMISYYKAMAGVGKKDLTVTKEDYDQNVKGDRFGRKTSFKDYENFMKAFSSVVENEQNTINTRFFNEGFDDERGQLGITLSPDEFETYHDGQRDSVSVTTYSGDLRIRTHKHGDGRLNFIKMSPKNKPEKVAWLEYHYPENPKPNSKPLSITESKNRNQTEYQYVKEHDLYTPDDGKNWFQLEENGLLTQTQFIPETIKRDDEHPIVTETDMAEAVAPTTPPTADEPVGEAKPKDKTSEQEESTPQEKEPEAKPKANVIVLKKFKD